MTPSRILVRSPNWLGDAVMALPAIGAIRRQFDSSLLAVAAPAAIAPLFGAVGGVDRVVSLSGGPGIAGVRGMIEDGRQLERERFDLAILLPNSFSSAWVARRAKVPERWGYRTDARGWLLTRGVDRRGTHRGTGKHSAVVSAFRLRVKLRRTAVDEAEAVRRTSPTGQHQSQYYLDLVHALGMDTQAPSAHVVVSADDRARAEQMLGDLANDGGRPLVGLAPGAAYGHAKRWPPERFAQLIARLGSELGARCVVFGTSRDRDAGQAIEGELARDRSARNGLRVVNLIGRTDLRLLMGLMTFCRAFVSNDSGAMHLASAVGLPVTAIFGPTNEQATAPLGPHRIVMNPVWCRPCLLRECPIDHRCLVGVSVASVFGAVADQVREAREDN